MRVDLNGEAIATNAATLAELVIERGLPAASVATALNGEFVPRDDRPRTLLREGARVEILSPMQGG